MCPPKPEPPEKDEFKDEDDDDKINDPEEKKPLDELGTDGDKLGNPEKSGNNEPKSPAHRSPKVDPLVTFTANFKTDICFRDQQNTQNLRNSIHGLQMKVTTAEVVIYYSSLQ